MVHLSRRGFTASIASLAASTAFLPRFADAQASEFRIGALCPITGAGAQYGAGMQRAIQFAANQVNAAGGAAGRQLRVFTEDDQTQPEAGVLAAKKLIEVNQVHAVVGTWASGVTLAVIPMAVRANVLAMNVSGAPDISALHNDGMSWRFHPTNAEFGKAFAAVCAKQGFKRPALMGFNNAFGLGLTGGFQAAWEKGGGKVAGRVIYEPRRPSYRGEVQEILRAKPDVIVMGSYLADTTLIMREAFQEGYEGRWIMPGWSANDQLVAALGPQATEGVISMDTIPNEGSGAFKSFDEEYRRAMNASGSSNVFAAMSYDMVISLALALEAAGPNASPREIGQKIRSVANPDGAKVYSFAEGKEALKRGKINYEGASGALDFDEFGDVKGNFLMSVIEKGRLVRKDVVAG